MKYLVNQRLFFCLYLSLFLIQKEVFAEVTCRTTKHVKVDKTYARIAEATGGLAYNADPNEILKMPLFAPLDFLGGDTRNSETGIEEGLAHLLKLNGALKSANSFEVDSTVHKLLINTQATEPSEFQLILPDGNLVRKTDPATDVSQYSAGCILKIENVKPGRWEFRVKSQGEVSFDVQARSSIRFSSFNFVKWSGVVHEGWFPMKTKPLIGSAETAMATIFGDKTYKTVNEFQVRSLEGETLQTIRPTHESGWDYLLNAVKVPKEMARVYVIGEDEQGHRFQRMHQSTIEGEQSIADAVASEEGSPLIDATIENDLKRVVALLDAGANINQRGDDDSTALMYAVDQKDDFIFRLLIDGEPISMRSQNIRERLYLKLLSLTIPRL